MFIVSTVVFSEIPAPRGMFPVQADGFKIHTTKAAGIDSEITEHSSPQQEKLYDFFNSFLIFMFDLHASLQRES